MTVFKIIVEDEQANFVKKLLDSVSFIKIEEETKQDDDNQSALDKIKKILIDAKGENLFSDIENPSEWQREIRKEWESDF